MLYYILLTLLLFHTVSSKMSETRWITLNRKVPNGGIPPGIMLMHDPNFSLRDYAPVASNPPNGGMPPSQAGWGLLPPAYDLLLTGLIPYHGATAPPATSTAPPAWTPYQLPAYSDSQCPPYEPPGQYVDGHLMKGEGWSYISPADHTTIFFVNGGVRPCDWPNGFCTQKFDFSKHKVPCNLTVRDLMKRLGCPDNETKGLTEVRESGSGQWIALDSFTQGGESSKQTLEQVGWTKERNETTPVWLVVKR